MTLGDDWIMSLDYGTGLLLQLKHPRMLPVRYSTDLHGYGILADEREYRPLPPEVT